VLVLFTRKIRTFGTQNVAHFVGGTEDAIGSSWVFAAQFIFSTFTGITLKTYVNKNKIRDQITKILSVSYVTQSTSVSICMLEKIIQTKYETLIAQVLTLGLQQWDCEIRTRK
jgi:hypothetical protein